MSSRELDDILGGSDDDPDVSYEDSDRLNRLLNDEEESDVFNLIEGLENLDARYFDDLETKSPDIEPLVEIEKPVSYQRSII